MSDSEAHDDKTDRILQGWFPDGQVPWQEATPPDLSTDRMTGRLRSCAYCGSMHPTDVATAIRAGAKGEWADWKYGWPHKAYINNVPNPHAGMLEIRASSSNFREGWISDGNGLWHEPGKPAPNVTMGKFYTVHLKDATPEEREVIETHLGLRFEFTDDGKVSWRKVE